MHERITDVGVNPAWERLVDTLEIGPGERLERAYVFDPIERGGVAFLLTLVTKRLADGRLEMTALGSRGSAPGEIALEFTRSARFPEDVLSSILVELIERTGAEGAAYREIHLGIAPGTEPAEQVTTLLERILPTGESS
jgi:hypothetical protein